MTKSKVLVTGGAGYVGSVLVRKLLGKNYDVRVIDSMIFGEQGLTSVKDCCEIYRGDIRNNELLKTCTKNMDHIIHLAAISNDPCSEGNPAVTKDVNLYATRDLVDIAKNNGVRRFIYASSSSVYGIREEPNVTEDLSLNPLTIYSQTKAQSEEIVRDSNSENFTAVNFRPATVCGYSPRMRLDLTVNIFTDHAVNNGKIMVFGGTQKRPNIHIEDVTDCYIDLLEAPAEKVAANTFNFGYENHSLMEIAHMVRKVIGEHVEIGIKPTEDLRSYHISSEKIRRELGITPKKTIEDAISDLKNAFERGLIPNPSSSIYRNMPKMKELGLI